MKKRILALPARAGQHRSLLWAVVVATALPLAGIAQVASARTIEHSTPASLAQAHDLGPAASSKVVGVTVWLREQSSSDAADKLVAQLYDPRSPKFHRWLGTSETAALLAPTP